MGFRRLRQPLPLISTGFGQTFFKYYHRFRQSGAEHALVPQPRGPKWKSRRVYGYIEQQVLQHRRLGINNLFDREPPIAGQEAGPSISGNDVTFPGLYDVLGRYLFIALTANFL